jgi:putative spermidine/putrescine transport system permease protein
MLGIIIRFLVFCVLAFILIPIIAMISASFSGAPKSLIASTFETLRFPPKGFSLEWYTHLFSQPMYIQGLEVSLALGISASLSALLIAVLLSEAFTRYRLPGRNMIRSLVLSPLIVPEVAIGLGLLQLFRAMGILGSFWSLLIAHIIIVMPFSLRIVESTFLSMEDTYANAARTLGANEFQTFRRVILQLARPGIVAAFIIGFVMSLNDVAMTVFLTTSRLTTVSVVMLGWSTFNLSPFLASAAGILIFSTLFLLLAIERTIGVEKALGFLSYG